MKKSLAFCLVVFSIFIILAATSTPSWAANYSNVGVKVGDYADYTASISSSNATRCHIYVYGMIGTEVALNVTYYDANGKAYPQPQWDGDIYIGGGSALLFKILTAGGLGKDDPIYSGSSAKVNETVTMTVGGQSRSVNHATLPGGTFDFYWDQASGLVVKMNYQLIAWWTNLTMTSTSMWPTGIPLTTILLIANLIEVALIVVVFFVGKRVGRRK